MTTSHPRIRLVDGPVVIPEVEERTEKVARMAKHLLAAGTFNDERDAIRSLVGNGFRFGEVVMLVDDARQVAAQHVVAVEMSRPL
ncbi:hypothetical protein QMZ05_12795 [Bradyrhizobium sp. INPA03-11B]|uniref:hypothetical protein n=1 Tax=Bradyrhizobium sp. INPA03-11B TaxID=418598 RepID=UPI00338DC1A5